MKKALSKIIIDMVPVVLGILIVLMLNNWKEKKDNERFLNKVLDSITVELQENKEELEAIIISHKAIIDTINLYMNDEQMAIGNIINKVNGFQGVNIKNTAWKSFLNTRIELVDYQLISALTDIDEHKQNLKMYIRLVTL